MIGEIFVEGRRLDISADISSLLTFALDDIRDFASRQTTFSKTVILPGSANNNAIFGNIFETGIRNTFNPLLPNIGYNFNASKSAKCIIFQDNIQTFKGTLRMLEIDLVKGQIEYQVALNGDLTTLNVALTSSLLTDLDFSAYDQTYNETNIVASWDNVPGSGVYFPMIDYGTYSTLKHDWDFRTFRPALYVKEYIDKMFAAAGFRYDSPFFNTARFKGFIVPHNQKTLQSFVTQVASGLITVSQEVVSPGSPGSQVLWDTVVAGGFSYSGGVFTYTEPTPLTTTIAWDLTGTMISSDIGGFDIEVRKNGSPIASALGIATGTTIDTYSYVGSVVITLSTGDTIDFNYIYLSGTDVIVTIDPSSPSVSGFTMTSDVATLQPVDYGQLIIMKDAIPQNIRQVDFLVSIVKHSNLYVYEDQFDDRLIKISPFVNFFEQGTGSVIDWTYKMDRDLPIRIKPMSEVNSKLYLFNFADDSDYYNDLYKKRYNQGYGSYIFDTEFEFASTTNKLDLIFASTPLVGYVGEEKVYPTIFKKSGTTEDRVDSVIRIMQTLKVTGVTSWNILNVAAVLGSYTSYGYAGHYDDPDNPNDDLNFGGLSELFFRLTTGNFQNTQFNRYWSGYMAEITDKDSKLLTAQFYLTAKDIFSLDFAKFIVVDGVLFRLNKITDYNVTYPGTCLVELINVIQTNYSYPIGSTAVDDYSLLWIDGRPIFWSDIREMNYK